MLVGICVVLVSARLSSAQEPLPATSDPTIPHPISSSGEGSQPDRLQKMEETISLLLRKVDENASQNAELLRQNAELMRQNADLSSRVDQLSGVSGPAATPRTAIGEQQPSVRDAAGGTFVPSAGGGSKAAGGDPTSTVRAQEVGNLHLGKLPIKSVYDFDNAGFLWSTLDDEFTFGVRGMTQVESRIYQRKDQYPVSSGFYNPRSRIYFYGHFSRPISYEFSFQNSFDHVGLLDSYINFNYDRRLQLRIGRYKTPFTYEFYRIHSQHLLSPERSLFANNYEGNRRFGAMAWGSLFDHRIEYAVGSFNTQRNSYQAFGDRQDVIAFVNLKPFYNREEGFLLRDLQFGGSVDAGNQDQPTVPAVLRTNSAPEAAGIDSSGVANSATIPFLAFQPNVMERGQRALWEAHVAYYNGGLSLLGAWAGGYENYSLGPTAPSSRIPINGWFAQCGYILTGETLRDRTLIEPLKPFDLRRGRFGLGAFEVTARYSMLELDRRVFAAGLADPTLWTNRAQMTDVGFNWYLNKFTKIYFDWEHAMFATPVLYNTQTGARQSTSDLFWIRLQIYF
jgi:phosphate-selective porin OprO/OprP